MVEIEELKRDRSRDYLNILRGVYEIPFQVGKNLLADFLVGDMSNESVKKNNLHLLNNFKIMKDYSREEVISMLDKLIQNGMIDLVSSKINRFWKVMRITHKGRMELIEPTLNIKKEYSFEHKTEINDEDKRIFEKYKDFLKNYNDEQKKAIVSEKEKILCIAGAGSGKTTVLTKRIEFLVRHKNVDPSKILAITFTRKARKEMQGRLKELGISNDVETFNSFCEKILRESESEIYEREMRVMGYADKMAGINAALESLKLKPYDAISKYFSESQRNSKSSEQLFQIFMNDCFFVLDYFKTKNKELYDFSLNSPDNFDAAKMLYQICLFLKEFMAENGLRDYTDQIIDAIKFFKSGKVPQYEHILVDEYQDVNSLQEELLDLLNPKNLFCVGDPRQSIYGWRGSDINYLLKFSEKHSDAEIINLVKNYRSGKHIVDIMNKAIRFMNLPDLKESFEGNKDVKLINFEGDVAEYDFVVNEILNSSVERKEIFVLARTNKQLNELSLRLREKGITHVVKSDEIHRMVEGGENDVTLATIHAIKGLEAKIVFVMGCNDQNFPCKASDHPVIEMIKVDEYDKEEEEKRLFYVALSRAKEKLFLTYTGKKPTYFIDDELMRLIGK